ncbi:uncharacterized protein LOC121984699 [Zingiber officinale]|uniref:E3 ubiquitin-protein ligase RMA n=1 Tax=Zingiber officinale TaxID=94328 RepID=A0A8J5GDC8_ZINOF|nr:uncharacterized protein LOC121984699 [Zingiber officinale]KAG6503746.1 hypothetical protein ZIOFF_036070 [Zingiber officinale]
MADERSDNGGGVDRNLYLSLPSLPRLENRDLGPELTVSSVRSPWSPFAHASALYSPSNALSTPDLLPADPLHAADPAFAYNFSSSQEPNAATPESQPLDGPSTVPNVLGHEPFARPSARHSDSQTPSSPPPQSFPRSGHGRVESVSAHIRLSELTADGNALSVQQELRQHPEYRFQLLIELLRNPRPAANAQGFNSDGHSLTSPERLLHDIMQPQRAMEDAKKVTEGNGVEDLEKKNEGIAAANFECNICYELAKAPVVTPCGHLYCWSCLYQWLHAHSVNSECPVCKGQVLEVNVTPIYGRGGEASKDDKQHGFGESNLKIPPRPPANRVENLRLRSSRERLEEGIANSWRNNVDEETHAGNWPLRRRYVAARTVVRRRPAQNLQREEGSGSNSAGVILRVNASSHPVIPTVIVPGGQAGLPSSSRSPEPSRHSAGSSASNAIAAPLGGTAIASPSAELITAMSSSSVRGRARARNPTLASSNAGGVHHTRRRMH